MGVDALDISEDALFIATLSSLDTRNNTEQQLAIWAWTSDETEAILRREFDNCGELHNAVKFNPRNKTELLTTGPRTVCFWNWDDYALNSYFGKVSKADLGHYGGQFSTSIFLPGTDNALTATNEGYVVLWEAQPDSNGNPESTSTIKVATKVLRLVETGITMMTSTVNDYLVLGCADGAVRFYDFFLRLEAWFEDLGAGNVTSVTFANQFCPYMQGEAGAPGLKFWVPDFIVGTADAFVIGVESSLFDEVKKEDRRGTLLLQGMSDEV
eukprot:gene30684-37937_t